MEQRVIILLCLLQQVHQYCQDHQMMARLRVQECLHPEHYQSALLQLHHSGMQKVMPLEMRVSREPMG
jgi:hypothetical protein